MVNVLSMGMSVRDGLMTVSVRVFTGGHDFMQMIVVAVVVSVSMFVLRHFVYVTVLIEDYGTRRISWNSLTSQRS